MRATWLVATALAATSAHASKPIHTSMKGCVVDGVFYSIGGRAYPMAMPEGVDLAPFEGKGIALHGSLYPGDMFFLDRQREPEVLEAICPVEALRLIAAEQVMQWRVAATAASQTGDHRRARHYIGHAMSLVTPPDCDTFTDRARVLVAAGDRAGAARDLGVLEAGACDEPAHMNPLLLQDLGSELLAAGDKGAARRALHVALRACDGDWCRDGIEKDLSAVKD